MTPDDIMALTTPDPDTPWQRRGAIFLPLLGMDTPRLVHKDLDTDAITTGMAETLTALLAAGPERWPEVVALLVADANQGAANSDYGFAQNPGETITQANLRAFGLNSDGTAPDGWAQKQWVDEIQVSTEGDEAEASLGFRVAWEEEHGCHIRLQSGTFETFNL
jgi:hypothetical protein